MNIFGNKFKITLFGASHAPVVGVLIEGVPTGIPLSVNDFEEDLKRRKSGILGTTPRIEEDIPEILSGVTGICTDGTPLVIVFKNNNVASADYEKFLETPRPGHADFTASIKYNYFNDIRGGGAFSGRMTLPLVAAGVVAKKIISPMEVSAHLSEAGGVTFSKSGTSPLENEEFRKLLEKTIAEGDSIGGVVECICNNVPIGLGAPFFDSLESQISHLAFSVPGIRGIEFGDGFAAARMKGSEHNDCFIDKEGHTLTNGAGGINGGISNGNPIVFRVAAKPTSSISKPQKTFNFVKEEMEMLTIEGRHDACFALRLPVVIEAVAASVLCDAILR